MRSIRYHYLNINPELIVTKNAETSSLSDQQADLTPLQTNQKNCKEAGISSYLIAETKS